MENKGKQKYNPRDDMSLDQAILQWIVDDYDIPDEKSRKIVGESGKKSKLITCKMVMDYLDNRGVVEETDETEFMRALRKRLYAKRLDKQNEGRKPSESAPGTKVYELVEMLRPYLLDTQ